MKQMLLQLDTNLFLLIYNLPHPDFLNWFFLFLSGIGSLGAVWIAALILLMIWEKVREKEIFYALFYAVLTVVVTVELIMKNIFKRLRPEFIFQSIDSLDKVHKSFSFPSGHATMSFAAAYILSKSHKKFALVFYFLAFLITFSRVYLGKHYPSDVVIGSVLGLVIGFVVGMIFGI